MYYMLQHECWMFIPSRQLRPSLLQFFICLLLFVPVAVTLVPFSSSELDGLDYAYRLVQCRHEFVHLRRCLGRVSVAG